jgi:cupin fold WbuC family metalloprotein
MVQLIDSPLFEEVTQRAAASARRRMNHNFHSGPDDNPHRFLNVLLRGTYIRPHRHLDPPKSETFLVLEGHIRLLVFNENGDITESHEAGDTLQPRVWGVDLSPGVWHTILALSDRAVCFEVKPGPWQPASDKEFAEWAPKEGDPDADAFLERLQAAPAARVR